MELIYRNQFRDSRLWARSADRWLGNKGGLTLIKNPSVRIGISSHAKSQTRRLRYYSTCLRVLYVDTPPHMRTSAESGTDAAVDFSPVNAGFVSEDKNFGTNLF
jgi:hypothetical protein